jgi:MoxR-like ATPase
MNFRGVAHSTWGWLKWYYWGVVPQDPVAEAIFLVEDAANVEPSITGEGLIGRILDTIRLRRSALVTGPRGCGKSYCSDVAIRRAADAGVIGGWRFLQGNREIPRDTLSEDALVINDAGKPELLRAIPLRPLDKSRWTAQRRAKHDAHVRERRKQFADWPAIPTMACNRAEALDMWVNDDWIVLYLDEINRFGDGFLDSLLSITEEGKLVRRGEDYFVPVSVVATANPPGYDVTAKKLSPPLQARIARSFRVAQPGFDDLVKVIIQPRLKDLAKQYSNQPGSHVPDDLARLAAAVTLCLWGDPGAGSQGSFFLTAATQRQLADVMRYDKVLRRAMKTLARKLISFGPDARAAQDWLGCAVGLAVSRKEPFDAVHLRGTAVEVLGHKVREVFNEGAEPALSALKEYCVAEVTRCVLDNDDVREQFVPPFEGAIRALAGAEPAAIDTVRAKLLHPQGQPPPARYELWLRALSRLPNNEGELDGWTKKATELGALTKGEVFFSTAEKEWVVGVLTPIRPAAANVLRSKDFDAARLLDALLESQPVLAQFRPELAPFVKGKHAALLSDDAGQRAWRDALRNLLTPASLEDATVDHALWGGLIGLVRPREPSAARRPAVALELLHETLDAIAKVANSVGKERCRRARDQLALLEELPLRHAMENISPTGTDDQRARIAAAVLHTANENRGPLNAEGEFVSRLAAWVKLLERLPSSSTNRQDLLKRAEGERALPDGRFASPADKHFATAMLTAVAAALDQIGNHGPMSTTVTSLAAALGGVPFSPSPFIRAWGRQESGLAQEQRQTAERDLIDALAVARIAKTPRLAERLSDSDSCKHLVQQLGALRELVKPEVSQAILAMWRTVFEVAQIGSPDDFSARADEVVSLLRDTGLLGLDAQDATGTGARVALTELARWDSTTLNQAEAIFGAPVGSRNILLKLIDLLDQLHATAYPLAGVLPVWLGLLPHLTRLTQPDELLALLKPRLTGKGKFLTSVEWVWLYYLAPPLQQWVKELRFDAAEFAAAVAAGGRYPVEFVQTVLEDLDKAKLLTKRNSTAVLSACFRLVDSLATTSAGRAVADLDDRLLDAKLTDLQPAYLALHRGVSASLRDRIPKYYDVLRYLSERGPRP